MRPGDRIRIHLHDTPAGYRVDMTDLKTHQSGSMTASVANGFAHVLYTPGSGPCQSAPYAFHAEYAPPIRVGIRGRHTRPTSRSPTRSGTSSTASSWTRTSTARWRAPTTRRWTPTTSAASREGRLDRAHQRLLRGDDDFDGPSYQNDWPGTNPDPKVDQKLHPQPVLFTSPTTTGGHNYPVITSKPTCPRSRTPATGHGCGLRQPAAGIAVLPLLLDPGRRRLLQLAGGRPVHPRDGERLRRKLGRVRIAAARPRTRWPGS